MDTPVQLTTAPAAIAATQSNRSSMNVGLVTDAGGVHDHAFNQLAWEGVQKAAKDRGFQATCIESKQTTDYTQNINMLATEGFNVIITVGSRMSDATALQAKYYPTITFAIIDHAYAPTNGSHYCDDTVKDRYTAGGLTNVSILMFAENQVGFLAGVLAGGMSKSGFVCSVLSLRTPASECYVISFHAGAAWQADDTMKIMNNQTICRRQIRTCPPSLTPPRGRKPLRD